MAFLPLPASHLVEYAYVSLRYLRIDCIFILYRIFFTFFPLTKKGRGGREGMNAVAV